MADVMNVMSRKIRPGNQEDSAQPSGHPWDVSRSGVENVHQTRVYARHIGHVQDFWMMRMVI